jgi:hypothetical protein
VHRAREQLGFVVVLKPDFVQAGFGFLRAAREILPRLDR